MHYLRLSRQENQRCDSSDIYGETFVLMSNLLWYSVVRNELATVVRYGFPLRTLWSKFQVFLPSLDEYACDFRNSFCIMIPGFALSIDGLYIDIDPTNLEKLLSDELVGARSDPWKKSEGKLKKYTHNSSHSRMITDSWRIMFSRFVSTVEVFVDVDWTTVAWGLAFQIFGCINYYGGT